MKVYNGWILEINGQDQKVIGSVKIRGSQSYVLKDASDKKSSIKRADLLDGYNSGNIKYLRSEAA